MQGIVKAMLIRELLEHGEVIGYRFRKSMESLNIKCSNGSIYYNLSRFEKSGYVKTIEVGKLKRYVLTPEGKEEFAKNLSTLPNNIEMALQEIGGKMPFINWTSYKEVSGFESDIQRLLVLVSSLKEELS